MTKRQMIVVGMMGLIGLNIAGCFMVPSSIKIRRAISKYADVSEQVKLGDTKEKVLSILLPTQAGVPARARKFPERAEREGTLIEIYYMRTGLTNDGRNTDDEFTPYFFVNGKLLAVGWNSAYQLAE